jgi:hypothetical protein
LSASSSSVSLVYLQAISGTEEMTRKETLEAIRALGLLASFDPETREYRVAPNLGPLPCGRGFQAQRRAAEERAAYYTPDATDATDTARRMSVDVENALETLGLKGLNK